jgi:hypothetical protein
MFEKLFRIFLIVFSELNSKMVPVVLLSANPSAFEVSKADSFLNLWSASSAARGIIGVSGIGASKYGRAMK